MTSSMDWSSGFYSVEDVMPVLELAKLMNFKDLSDVEDYIRYKENGHY